MTDLIVIHKRDADRLCAALSTHFPIGCGGAVGEVLGAIYQMAEHSYDLPTGDAA